MPTLYQALYLLLFYVLHKTQQIRSRSVEAHQALDP